MSFCERADQERYHADRLDEIAAAWSRDKLRVFEVIELRRLAQHARVRADAEEAEESRRMALAFNDPWEED